MQATTTEHVSNTVLDHIVLLLRAPSGFVIGLAFFWLAVPFRPFAYAAASDPLASLFVGYVIIGYVIVGLSIVCAFFRERWFMLPPELEESVCTTGAIIGRIREDFVSRIVRLGLVGDER